MTRSARIAIGSAAVVASLLGLMPAPSASAAFAESVAPAASATNSIGAIAGDGIRGSLGDGGPAAKARLDNPGGVAESLVGTLYIADSGNNQVRQVVNPTLINEDVITVVAGSGRAGFAGDGHPAVDARLDDPTGVAVDSKGDVFVADSGNNRVREVLPDGIIKTVAGDGRCTRVPSEGNGLPAVQASLCAPTGVAVGKSGLYISDTGHHEVRIVSPSGVISDFAGDGVLGSTGNGGTATRAELAAPEGLAVNAAGNVFMADTGVEFLTFPHGRHHRPVLIVIGSNVREVVSGVIKAFAGNGVFGYSGDGGRATKAELNGPTGVGVDALGDVFISDTLNSRIRRVDGNGIITTYAGTGRAGFSGNGGPATKAELDHPTGTIAIDSDAVYFADLRNQQVRGVFSGPPPVLPEVRWTLALPASAVLVGGAAFFVRRRRRSRMVAAG